LLLASIFTPTWGLGLLLGLCLLLPCYQGCNDTTIYGYGALAEASLTVESAFETFLLTWPFAFGLLAGIGTVAMLLTRRPLLLWWAYAGLILAYGAIQLTFLASRQEEIRKAFATENRETMWISLAFFSVAIVLLAMLLLTRRYCRSPVRAAMWLQGALAVLAAVSISILIPMLYLAQGPLFGAKIAHVCCLLLIVTSIVGWFEGQRVFSRETRSSPLQLSLRATLVLMLVGGLLFAWGITFALHDLIAAGAEAT